MKVYVYGDWSTEKFVTVSCYHSPLGGRAGIFHPKCTNADLARLVVAPVHASLSMESLDRILCSGVLKLLFQDGSCSEDGSI